MSTMKKKEKLTDKEIFGLLKKNENILKKHKVKRIGLFGSHVRGSQKPHSDVDFLVEFKEPTFDNFMGLIFDLEGLFGKKVELITNGSLSPYIQPLVEKEVRWYEA